jgi:hypothetical protein
MSSWNQIKKKLLEFSQSHQQVNSFGTGDALSIGTDNTINLINSSRDSITYPLVFADFDNASFNDSMRTMQVVLFVMDRVEEVRNKPTQAADWRDNEDEVISDMFEVVSDFVSAFQDDPTIEYTLNSSVVANRFLDARDDKVAGWRAVLNFELPFSRSICIIPQ